jgi:hypothetical protein
MKLFLHIGTEKTGSSFLQSYLAKSRNHLVKQGIYYPPGGIYEKEMMAGKISAGNASELSRMLYANKWVKIKSWLKKQMNVTKAKDCHSIVLSNEILVKNFANETQLLKFINICNEIKLEIADMLLYIREPVSQTLSLYKHRSKNGKMLPIAEWLTLKYDIAECLDQFYTNIDNTQIKLKQFPYKKDSTYLVEVCFNQWLDLNHKINIEVKSAVNPSLTLSELVLLAKIHQQNPLWSESFFEVMINIDPMQKSDDRLLKDFITLEINNYLVRYNDLWQKVLAKMTVESKPFVLQKKNKEEQSQVTSFSPVQLEAIAIFIKYSKTSKYKAMELKLKLKNQLIKITPKSILKLRKKIVYGGP